MADDLAAAAWTESADMCSEEKPWYWLIDNIAVIAVTSSLCVIWTFMPTRFITRLSLIKRYPISPSSTAPGKVTEFLRMQHGGHLMALSEKAPVRDLAISDVAVRAIGKAGEHPLGVWTMDRIMSPYGMQS
jgi:hypothetical protein